MAEATARSEEHVAAYRALGIKRRGVSGFAASAMYRNLMSLEIIGANQAARR